MKLSHVSPLAVTALAGVPVAISAQQCATGPPTATVSVARQSSGDTKIAQNTMDMPGMPGMKKAAKRSSAAATKTGMAQPQGKDMPGMKGMKDQAGMPSMDMSASSMKGILGNWPAAREGSGTSWQTDSAPMFMKMLGSPGGFDLGMMGILQAGYADAGGRRGGRGMFSTSMIMLMGRKEMGGGILGLHFMTSLDPLLNGRRGIPNLFQNPFTVHDIDISDRKDPHNIFAEVALSYSHPLSRDLTGFIYGGPAGEPALGGAMYLHRTSGMEIPEAPISHDWFDGSHISFGVATLGLAWQKKWKVEASAFNSAEPGANLYGIGRFVLNSTSGRVTFNPSPDWSFSTSYGYLNSDVNQHRLTLSAAYSHPFSNGDTLSATTYFGQNIITDQPNSNAWVAEATYFHRKDAFFTRFERVDKGELLDVPPGSYTINKLLFGDVHSFYSRGHLDYGLGAYVGLYSFPGSLNAAYGRSPVTFGVFVRIRPGKQ